MHLNLAKFDFDTAENEPAKICKIFQINFAKFASFAYSGRMKFSTASMSVCLSISDRDRNFAGLRRPERLLLPAGVVAAPAPVVDGDVADLLLRLRGGGGEVRGRWATQTYDRSSVHGYLRNS